MAISYNLGMALFVSTQFDVQTYLADLDEYWGCLYSGLYILAILFMSIGAVVWAENYHSWDDAIANDNARGDDQAIQAVPEESNEIVSLAPAI